VTRISRVEVEWVAHLARLALSDQEAERMTRDLDRILDYVAQLQELDTSGVEPTSHAVPLPTPLRPDRAEPGMAPELVLANAPDREDDAFAVPRVLASDDEG
jgi:aspartyl-tRNA(Asn)/glutamyl-tRNA(Gln) amidotransferase subunit C